MTDQQPGSGERILLIAPGSVETDNLRDLLEGEGFSFKAVADLDEAMQVAESFHPALLLIDGHESRGMTGLRLLSQIKRNAHLQETPAIFLSEQGDDKDDLKFLELGAADFVSKPYGGPEIIARVNMNLTTSALRQELARSHREIAQAYSRMHSDLEAAARVQQASLPVSLPESDMALFAWAYRPCDKLGGDSLNICKLTDRYFALHMVDVRGHGVPAALMSVSVTHSLRPSTDVSSLITDSDGHPTSPAQVAQRLNLLYPMAENANHYFTLLYGLLDSETLLFRYVAGGHPGPVLIRKGEAPRHIASPGRPIGMLASSEFKNSELQLEVGDRLYLFSDALNEECNSEDVEFGFDRLVKAFADRREESLDQSLASVQKELADWCGRSHFMDDFSVLAVEVTGSRD